MLHPLLGRPKIVTRRTYRFAPTDSYLRSTDSALMGIDVDRIEGTVEKELICALCSKVFESPVVGKCGHTFCSICLERAAKRQIDCPTCGGAVTKDGSAASTELVEELGKLSIHCEHRSSGCETVVPLKALPAHATKECAFRMVPCENRGCKATSPLNELESHMDNCEYRLVECKVCKTRTIYKDMAAHQAIKRCFEKLNKRRMVSSARRLSQEVREHRVDMQHQRHLTDQAERRLVREHYEREVTVPRRRAMSAGPILLRSSVQARVGSAVVVPHYSRNLQSAAVMESCRGCSGKFLSGRRPSAKRHSHSKVRLPLVVTNVQN